MSDLGLAARIHAWVVWRDAGKVSDEEYHAEVTEAVEAFVAEVQTQVQAQYDAEVAQLRGHVAALGARVDALAQEARTMQASVHAVLQPVLLENAQLWQRIWPSVNRDDTEEETL